MLNADDSPAYREYVPFGDPHWNLYALVYWTHRALFEARRDEVMIFGITAMECALLTVVQGLGGSATPAEISRWMMRRRPTISGLLDRMERNGLVRRTEYPGNKKLKKVVMTEKGEDALRRAWRHDIMHDIMSSLSEEEFRELWSLLEKLRQAAISLTQRLGQQSRSAGEDAQP